jgi:hypothetical protein
MSKNTSVVSSADIASIFDEIRDQRDAANKRAESSEASAAQLQAEIEHQKALVNFWIAQYDRIESERDELRAKLEQAQNAAEKFSSAHVNVADNDGEIYPCCDPQDWAEFDRAFGIEDES